MQIANCYYKIAEECAKEHGIDTRSFAEFSIEICAKALGRDLTKEEIRGALNRYKLTCFNVNQ